MLWAYSPGCLLSHELNMGINWRLWETFVSQMYLCLGLDFLEMCISVRPQMSCFHGHQQMIYAVNKQLLIGAEPLSLLTRKDG